MGEIELDDIQRHLGVKDDNILGRETLDAIAEAIGMGRPVGVTALTVRMVLELGGHEALVQEAYLDTENVWTWALGVTDASGHRVQRYKDSPQPVMRCLEVSLWLIRTKYLPETLAAFSRPLTEEQLAAALSFHWNTGAIGRAVWVKQFNLGEMKAARSALVSNFRQGGTLQDRRNKEAALFFDGEWSNDGKINVLSVSKPSYKPSWKNVQRVDISGMVADLIAKGDA